MVPARGRQVRHQDKVVKKIADHHGNCLLEKFAKHY